MWRGIFIALVILPGCLAATASWAKITSTADAIRQQREVLQIAVLDSWSDDKAKTEAQWQPLADHLNRTIPFYYFNLQVLSEKAIRQQLEVDKLDLVITDPGLYVTLHEEYGARHFLTLERYYPQGLYNHFGSLLLAAKDQVAQNDIANLTGSVTLLHPKSEPRDTFSSLWLGLRAIKQQKNVDTVSTEAVEDALSLVKQVAQSDDLIGHLPSGAWERLQQQHPDLLAGVEILNSHPDWGVPFRYSTELMPEWPLSSAWYTPRPLLRTIAVALLSASEHLPMQQKQALHWSIPQSYTPVRKLYADLDKAPFKRPYSPLDIEMGDILKEFWQWLLAGSLLLLFLTLGISYVVKLNQRLKASAKALKAQIDERNSAQERALQHQADLAHVARLSTMGEMASGLAHELNQPLSAINSYVQGCSRRIKNNSMEPEPLLRALDLTAQQATRAGEIIRRLRNFVRKGEPHKTPMDINHVVHEVVNFLSTPLEKKQVKLKLELVNDPPPVFADIIQIEQVLLNLVKNAIEAMNDTPVEERLITITTKARSEQLVQLSVADKGHGISQDKIDRVFNPFFTTKNTGMGMGLSISHSIIEAHGGHLGAENNGAQGALFYFTLPIMQNNNNAQEGYAIE